MNNTPNDVSNNPNGANYQAPPQYYQPPSYYPPSYNSTPAPGQFYPKKQPYTEAAEKALDGMNVPLFLILSIIFGWVCSRTLWSGHIGVGMTVMGVLFYVFYLPFVLHKQHKKVPLSAWLLFIPQIAVLASFSLYASALNKTCGLLLSLAIVMIQTTLIAGCTEGRPFSKELISDACASYLAYPFLNMTQTVKVVCGIGKNQSDGKKGKVGSKILLGLIISIPVVIVLILILSNADQMFSIWIDKVVDVLNISFGRILADIILTAITMLYVMPLVVSLRSGYHTKSVETPYNRPLDAIITTTVLFVASLVYLVFVAVQFQYLFAGQNRLPVGFTYAEYCRRGFFELVFITAVTTAVIAAVCMLTKHNDKDKLPAYTKAALLLISACDCVMIVSAAHRLVIYVREYGMTIARLNVAVIIAFMAVCILVMALKIIFEKLKVSAIIGSALIVLLAAYSVFNVDGFIAKYNVDRYLNDTSKELDVDYIQYNLSLAAIPELDRLAEATDDPQIKNNVENGIIGIIQRSSLIYKYRSVPLAKWTWDYQKASNIIEKYQKEYRNHSRSPINVSDSDWVSRSDYVRLDDTTVSSRVV